MAEQVRFGFWVRVLHWVSALLVVLAVVLIEMKGLWPKGSAPREAVKLAHAQFGVAVLLLWVPRLALTLARRTPPITPPPPRWQTVLRLLDRVVLYGLLLGVPVLGVLMMQAKGKTPTFLGLPLPSLVGADRALGRSLEQVHETLGNVMVWFAVAHAIAALWQHTIVRNNALERMLFRRRGRERAQRASDESGVPMVR
jgi:cytochrome b561